MKTLIPVAYVMNLSLSRLVFDNLFTVFTDLKINNFEKKKQKTEFAMRKLFLPFV